MINKQPTTRKINIRFAALQAVFWASAVPTLAYTTVFLQHRKLTNTQIGLTTAVGSFCAIIIQAVVSHFADKNPNIPLKVIISVFFMQCIITSTVLMLIPVGIALLMIIYIMCLASSNSINSFTNALFMQYKNSGLNVNFGIPRAVGSLFFALVSLLLGYVMELYTPEILMPAIICFCGMGIVITASMPRYEGVNKLNVHKQIKTSSTWSMIRHNPTFVLLCISTTLVFVGQSYTFFYINIVKNVGGNTVELGLILFIGVLFELPGMLLSTRLLKRFKSKDLVVVSIFGFLMKAFVIALAPNMFWIIVSMSFSLIASGIYFFSTLYFVDEIVKPDQITRGQAFFGLCSIGGVGTVLGSLFNGMIIDRFGISILLIFCTVICCIGFALILIVRRMYARHFTIASASQKNAHQYETVLPKDDRFGR